MVTELTTREREIAWLAAERSTREIAEQLGCSPSTVKVHLRMAKLKLGVKHKRDLPAALRLNGSRP